MKDNKLDFDLDFIDSNDETELDKYCNKCGEKNVNSAVFCIKCRAKIGSVSSKTKNIQEVNTNKSKSSYWNWLLWWRIDKETLTKQVNEYSQLKITQSYRGISSMLMLFSAGLSIIFILFNILTSSAYVDAGLFILLAFFMYRGHKWAFIAGMVLWTIEKFNQLTTGFNITAIIWWALYIHYFYGAFKIEKLRHIKYNNL
jgi:hypothetical protein